VTQSPVMIIRGFLTSLSLAHHHMGFPSLFSALLCFIAAAHAGQLTVQSPRLTIIGPDGGQLSSEQYATHILFTLTEKNNSNRISLTKRPDPVTLGPSDTLKLTFQVAEQATDNGVQPHQTFLRFFDSTTGEEGIQPVKIAPSGKAKFELVRCFLTCATWPAPTNQPSSPIKTSEYGQAPELSPAFRCRTAARLPPPWLLRAQSRDTRPL
jgi:oligosaccharyltransferase complex subunit delta (ribophorin II)